MSLNNLERDISNINNWSLHGMGMASCLLEENKENKTDVRFHIWDKRLEHPNINLFSGAIHTHSFSSEIFCLGKQINQTLYSYTQCFLPEEIQANTDSSLWSEYEYTNNIPKLRGYGILNTIYKHIVSPQSGIITIKENIPHSYTFLDTDLDTTFMTIVKRKHKLTPNLVYTRNEVPLNGRLNTVNKDILSEILEDYIDYLKTYPTNLPEVIFGN